MKSFFNIRDLLRSLEVDPITAKDPVKRMCVCDGDFLTANIATGAEAGSSLHMQPAHDELVIVLEGEAEFQVGTEIRHVAPGDIVFIPPNTLHGRVRTTTPKWGRAVNLRPVL